MKKRIFSGIRPTGSLHIGNYIGAIKNWLELQEKYDSIFCVVDLHALTTPKEAKQLQDKIFDIATTYIAAGIDPKKCTLFVQSHVPEHTELSWLLGIISKIPELERMTQFKEKAAEHRSNVNMGLLAYPVLMAADILIYQTDIVPVGDDQKQHVELARTIARRFNHLYGDTFTVPKVLLKKEEEARIKGLDNPLKKMSKTSPNPYNYISLNDSPDIIKDKIKKAVTDSGKDIKHDPERPAITNLMTIYSSFSDLTFDQIEKKYINKNYAEFKEDLSEVIIEGLKDFQKKKKELDENPDYIKKILQDGAKKAQKIAQKNLLEAKKKMGLL